LLDVPNLDYLDDTLIFGHT